MRYKPEPNRLEKLQAAAHKRVTAKKRKEKTDKERQERKRQAEADRESAKKNAFIRMPEPVEWANKWHARFGEWPKGYNHITQKYE